MQKFLTVIYLKQSGYRQINKNADNRLFLIYLPVTKLSTLLTVFETKSSVSPIIPLPSLTRPFSFVVLPLLFSAVELFGCDEAFGFDEVFGIFEALGFDEAFGTFEPFGFGEVLGTVELFGVDEVFGFEFELLLPVFDLQAAKHKHIVRTDISAISVFFIKKLLYKRMIKFLTGVLFALSENICI